LDSDLVIKKTMSTNITYPLNQSPVNSSNIFWRNLSFNRKSPGLLSDTPSILRGKEELAPEYMFSSY
jgi:hypothetical protein